MMTYVAVPDGAEDFVTATAFPAAAADIGNPGGSSATPIIKATPYIWREPNTIPRRQWLYGYHLVRRFVSCTIAPGGVGKSSLALIEAVSMASGRNLLGIYVREPYRVWYWNGEDPLEEIERRVAAICLHFNVTEAQLGGRLFINSGRDTDIILATMSGSATVIAMPIVNALHETIRENNIDILYIDPFVASHAVTENDNMAIGRVAKTWSQIADRGNCAIDLIHHARKTNGSDVKVEDGRGAVALLSAARSARALNSMTKDEGERAGIANPRTFFRVDNGKANLAPPPEKSDWYQLHSVSLENGSGGEFDDGDRVAVVTPWKWPDVTEGVTVADLRAAQCAVNNGGPWRENPQASGWVGKPIAEALKIDISSKGGKKKVIDLLKVWTGTGMFRVVRAKDKNHEIRAFVEVVGMGQRYLIPHLEKCGAGRCGSAGLAPCKSSRTAPPYLRGAGCGCWWWRGRASAGCGCGVRASERHATTRAGFHIISELEIRS
jgi:hypothetical protein